MGICRQSLFTRLKMKDYSLNMTPGVLLSASSSQVSEKSPDALEELAIETWHIFRMANAMNEDESKPGTAKLSWVGTSIQRVPTPAVLGTVVEDSYNEALQAGFMGTLSMWNAYVKTIGLLVDEED